MLKRIRKAVSNVKSLLKADRDIESIKINQGIILSELNSDKEFDDLSDYSFKVFSQWGEDGIIQHLTKNLKIENKTFVEFGVEDFQESNCRFLMMKDNWSGFTIDGSFKNVNRCKSSYYYWQYDIYAHCEFIDKDNIDGIIRKSGFDERLGILSVDIDGVDYFVLEKLSSWLPDIIIVEYNPVFGEDRPLSVPYDKSFRRSKAHWSNLYYGANVRAFDYLLSRRGYSLVGINKQGSNAFFVRNELLNARIRSIAVDKAARPSTFRESRDSSGELSYLSMSDRRKAIGSLPVIDVATGERMDVASLFSPS